MNDMKVSSSMRGGRPPSLRLVLQYLRRHWFLYALVVPGLAFLLVFSYGPMYGLLLAFKDFNYKLGILQSPWAGLKYFRLILSNDNFYMLIRNTVVINLYNIAIGFTFTIFLALMINEVRANRIKRIYQTAVYLPYFLSWVVFSGLIVTFLDTQSGMVNGIIRTLGGTPINFLTNNSNFRGLLVVTNTIKTAGYSTIIYLAAIAGVNPELYESAKVDGGNRFHLLRYITVPRILPTITVLLILQLSNLFSSNFDQVFNLYSPMVFESGDVISTYIYRAGIVKAQYSESTAMNLMFNTAGLFIVLCTNKLVKKMDVMGLF